jgi:predicted transcriptional regulator
MRTAARQAQHPLAKKVGTTAPVICRLEDADYKAR